MEANSSEHELKDGMDNKPKTYLDVMIKCLILRDGQHCWSMRSDKYVISAVETVHALLAEDG
jgi:hypothetical protein